MEVRFKCGDKVQLIEGRAPYLKEYGIRTIDQGTVVYESEDNSFAAVEFYDWHGRPDLQVWVRHQDLRPYGEVADELHPTITELPEVVTWDTNVRCTTPARHKCPRAPWWAFWNPCSRFGWLTYAAAGACVPAAVEAIVRHLPF